MVCEVQAVAGNVTGGSIEECGHWIPVECPQELARRILAFWTCPDSVLSELSKYAARLAL